MNLPDANLADSTYQPELEAYLARALDGPVRLLEARRLTKSTREAPWLLEVEFEGEIRRYVLISGEAERINHEHSALKAMEPVSSVATPGVYGLGELLGCRCFLEDFVEGKSLLGPMLAGEPWAEELYLESVQALQAVTAGRLGPFGASLLPGQSALDIREETRAEFEELASQGKPHPLAGPAHARLVETQPDLPELRFSNGDLYLDNFLTSDRRLAGIIDFENAGFSDPVYEFLLSFFIHPELRGRGTEERFCRRIKVDPETLRWYHGLEFFELLAWAVRTGRSFEGHTAESLSRDLDRWLSGEGAGSRA